MNQLFKKTSLVTMLMVPKYNYHFPNPVSQTHHKPGLTAKRVIKCISERLIKFDPDRWTGVPFSFNTHWKDEGGYMDIQTAIQVHQALEREFGIEIKDRHLLVQDMQQALFVVLQHHDSV